MNPVLGIAPNPHYFDVDQLDKEHQQLVFERLHFLSFLEKIAPIKCCGQPAPILANGVECQLCRKTGVNLVGHHVVEVDEGGADNSENIWSVCDPCHAVIHALRRIAKAAP